MNEQSKVRVRSRRAFLQYAAMAAGASALSACAAPTPQVVEKIVTQVVEKQVVQTQLVEKQVVQTQMVEKTVEKSVEKQVVVTATPLPVQVNLVFWDSSSDPVKEAALKEGFTRFAAQYPNVKVQWVPGTAQTYLQKLTTAIGGGKPPDIVEMQGGWLSQFGSMGALLDLDPHISKWKDKDDYLPALLKLGRAYANKLYYIPADNFNLGIIYRPDWFKEANLTSPQELYKAGKWTWDEFVKAGTALTNAPKNRYGYTLRGGFGGERNLFAMMMAWNGGKWFADDGTCQIGGEDAIKGVDFYADMFRKAKISPNTAPTDGWREVTTNFSSGVAAMYMHSQDGMGAQRPVVGWDKVAAAPLPAGPKGAWQQLDGVGNAAMAQTKWPEMAAAYCFFAQSTTNFDIAIKKDVDAGKKPFTSVMGVPFKSLLERKEFKDDPDFWAFLAITNSPNVVLNPLHLPEYTSIVNGMILPEFQKVLLGQMTAKDACTHWAAEFTKVQKAYLERLKVG